MASYACSHTYIVLADKNSLHLGTKEELVPLVPTSLSLSICSLTDTSPLPKEVLYLMCQPACNCCSFKVKVWKSLRKLAKCRVLVSSSSDTALCSFLKINYPFCSSRMHRIDQKWRHINNVTNNFYYKLMLFLNFLLIKYSWKDASHWSHFQHWS